MPNKNSEVHPTFFACVWFFFFLLTPDACDCNYFKSNLSLLMYIKVLLIETCNIVLQSSKQLPFMHLFLRLPCISLGQYCQKNLSKVFRELSHINVIFVFFSRILWHKRVTPSLEEWRRGPKKSSLVSGNRLGEKQFISHPPTWSNVYQNTYFQFQKSKIKNNKKTKSKINSRRKENICGKYNSIQWCNLRICFAYL